MRSMIENQKIRKQRAEGKAVLREGDAERSPSAATCAEEHKRHRRPSAGTSQHNMTKSRFQPAQGKWRGSASRRSHSYLGRAGREAVARSRARVGDEPEPARMGGTRDSRRAGARGSAVGGDPAGGVRPAVSRGRSSVKPTSRSAMCTVKWPEVSLHAKDQTWIEEATDSDPDTLPVPAISGPHGSSRGAESGGLSKASFA